MLVLLIDSVALFTIVWSVTHATVGGIDVLRLGLLGGLAVVYYEASRRVADARGFFAIGDESHHVVYVNMTSVCMLAAAVILPSGLASVLVVVVYAHLWVRASGPNGGRPLTHRYLYTVATTVLMCASVSGALSALHVSIDDTSTGQLALMLVGIVIPVFIGVNSLLVAAAIYASTGIRKPAALLGSWAENGLELATLALGSVTALSILYAPWAAVLVLPAVFLLQHQALLRQLVEAATTDVKTDLLNATAWRQIALREVTRAGQRGGSAAILVLDMDHFKRINDQHGHLVGDAALRAVAAALADELRGYDAVGRFGGEEFVAVLPDTDVPGAEHAAERLRVRIESLAVPVHGSADTLSVTASIGVALCPEHGDLLDDVLRAADDAMYDAKRAGRNTVRTAPAAAWLRTAAS